MIFKSVILCVIAGNSFMVTPFAFRDCRNFVASYCLTFPDRNLPREEVTLAAQETQGEDGPTFQHWTLCTLVHPRHVSWLHSTLPTTSKSNFLKSQRQTIHNLFSFISFEPQH